MQQTRQWMVTHKWMVEPMPQTEWIERRGVLVWIAEVFTSLGAGLYLVSLFLNSWEGALVAWLIISFLKVPIHIAYFGKPLRFWRTIPPFSGAWRTSWFCRGIVFTILFTGFAFLQLVTSYLVINGVIAGSAMNALVVVDILFKVLGGLFAFMTGIYGGFIMGYCKSVPFWNTGLLPIVFIVAGVADGLALVMAIGLGVGGVDIGAVESASRFLLIINALLIGTYLLTATYQSVIAKLSTTELIVGHVAFAFWVGIVLFGILIPIVISIVSIFTGKATASLLLVVAIASHTLGAFALKYCLLKVGIHRPILPKASAY